MKVEKIKQELELVTKIKLANEEKTKWKKVFRVNEPKEKIKFYAHSGTCKYCGGIVKMERDSKTLKLILDKCQCLLCGQQYYVETDNADEFDIMQWEQKGKEESKRDKLVKASNKYRKKIRKSVKK